MIPVPSTYSATRARQLSLDFYLQRQVRLQTTVGHCLLHYEELCKYLASTPLPYGQSPPVNCYLPRTLLIDIMLDTCIRYECIVAQFAYQNVHLVFGAGYLATYDLHVATCCLLLLQLVQIVC